MCVSHSPHPPSVSLSISLPSRSSSTHPADSSSKNLPTNQAQRGEDRETKKNAGKRRDREERRQRLYQRGDKKEGKKIENQEKRSLKGAERSGVWRRGDKGRGLTTGRDKYGAMHHSGNTGRTKTLSHETGKRPFGSFFVPAQPYGIVVSSRQTTGVMEHRCNSSVQRRTLRKDRLQLFLMFFRPCVSVRIRR